MPAGVFPERVLRIPELYIKVVLGDDYVFGLDLVEVLKLGYGLSAFIHVGLGFGQNKNRFGELGLCYDRIKFFVEFKFIGFKFFRKKIHEHKTDIVPGILILFVRIP